MCVRERKGRGEKDIFIATNSERGRERDILKTTDVRVYCVCLCETERKKYM